MAVEVGSQTESGRLTGCFHSRLRAETGDRVTDVKEGVEGFRNLSRPIALLARITSLLPRGRGAVPRFLGASMGRLLENGYVVTRHGAKLMVTPSALDFFTSMASSNWSFDYWVMDTCASLLPAGGVFYDVGANVGYLSVEMARMRPDCSGIVSFEPQAEMARNLERSGALNAMGALQVVNACVGDRNGDAVLVLERHAVHAHISYPGREQTGRTVPARMIRIDDLVESGEAPAPDVMKIDVEGFEYQVLSGAADTISRVAPHVVFELSETTARFARAPVDFFEFFRARGDYAFEIAMGSYRESRLITDTGRFNNDFLARPYLVNILARARGRTLDAL